MGGGEGGGVGGEGGDRQRGAQAHRPITDDRHACACLDVRADRRVMACRHDISQGQKSLEQGLISLHFWRHNDQGGIGKACPNRLAGLLAFMPKAPDTTLQAPAAAPPWSFPSGNCSPSTLTRARGEMRPDSCASTTDSCAVTDRSWGGVR